MVRSRKQRNNWGGYYLLDCTDMDEALKYAAMIPTSEFGRIEVRPVMVWDT